MMIQRILTKLANLFRSKGTIGATRYILRAVGYRYRKFLDDTLFDWRYGTETSLIEKEYLFSADSRHSEDFQFYEAVKWRDFQHMIRSLPESSLDDFSFIDVGCGKGRALLFASTVGFRKIIGVELSSRLASISEANIAKFQAKTGILATFNIVHCEVSDFMIPDENQVIFLYNPFVGETMRSFINAVADACRKYQRKVYILYRNPVCHDIISSNEAVHTIHVNDVFVAYKVDTAPTTKDDSDELWYESKARMCKYSAARRLRNALCRRRCHAFSLGTSKSGTHSIHGLFSKHFRSSHEPESMLLNKLIIDAYNRVANTEVIRDYYLLRDRYMYLEMESNSFNQHFIGLLVDLFPRAKFILTYRDPGQWLNSWINHVINRPEQAGSIWAEGLKAQYRPDQYSYGQEEDVFRQYGLFPLASYLGLWSRCNESILNFVPPERLLIIRTEEISESAGQIADFLNIKESLLCLEKSHQFKSLQNHKLLDQIRPEYLEKAIEDSCGTVIAQLSHRLSEQFTR